jgi:glycosyltransferase involved in cell wall biosynthesis
LPHQIASSDIGNRAGAGCVAVVITTYARVEPLRLAILSALSQGSAVREVIVVDDNRDSGLSAEVARIVHSFRSRKLKYLTNTGKRGPAAARNVGINHASAEFIAFLDDDDYWLKGKLEAQLQLMHPDVVGVDCGFVEKDGNSFIRVVSGDGRTRTQNGLLQGECPSSTSLMVVRRSIALQAGLFDEDIAGFEDFEFWLRCAQFGKFANAREPLSVYHQHAGYRVSSSAERLQGLEQLIRKWRHLFRDEGEVAAFRRKWTVMQLATNSRRALGTGAHRAMIIAVAAIRVSPCDRRGWTALACSVLGARASRNFRRLRHSRYSADPVVINEMRELERSARDIQARASTQAGRDAP